MEEARERLYYSPKKKMVTFLLLLLGGFAGLHAFYARRFKRGFFFFFSVGISLSYILFVVFYIKTSYIGKLVGATAEGSLLFYLLNASILSHIPFVGWLANLGSYPFYILMLGIIVLLYDMLLILLGEFRDNNNYKIVSSRRKQK